MICYTENSEHSFLIFETEKEYKNAHIQDEEYKQLYKINEKYTVVLMTPLNNFPCYIKIKPYSIGRPTFSGSPFLDMWTNEMLEDMEEQKALLEKQLNELNKALLIKDKLSFYVC